MSKVVLDETLRAKLNDLTEHVEICDPAGNTLGHYLPAELYHRLLYEGVEDPISDEELERRLGEPGGRSLAEILADLEKS
jgi:hypothetical protein